MDPDDEIIQTYNHQEHPADAGDVLQPFWFRCTLRPGDGVDRFLLDYGHRFLLRVGLVLWVVLLAHKILPI